MEFMRWWIVEDALRDRTGHWLEYIRVFRAGLEELGDNVRVLAARDADLDVVDITGAEPLLPNSIWHRLTDGAGSLRRFGRVFSHARSTCRVMVPELSQATTPPDVIYVPTVLPHHLLAWWWMLRRGRIPPQCRLLLYFLSSPVIRDSKTGVARISGGPTAHLLRIFIGLFATDVRKGRVVLGVETEPLRNALHEASGVPFTYLPQPVEKSGEPRKSRAENRPNLLMACYGAARHEKGSDLLQSAIIRYLRDNSDTSAEFVIQWLEPFQDSSGREVKPDESLESDQRVSFIRRYFEVGEYFRWLSKTDVILLPYRLSSYDLRGSRVALEAMVDGIPVVVTKDSAPGEQSARYGAAILCEDENVEDLARAIGDAANQIDHLRMLANERSSLAREHFSVKTFRRILLETLHHIE